MPFLQGTNLIVLFILSFVDSIFTYEWAKICLKKKPSLKVKQVESNPFIVTCWNNFGLGKGSIISGLMLFGVQILISSIHKYAFYLIALILAFAVYNHINNFFLMKKKRIKAFQD